MMRWAWPGILTNTDSSSELGGSLAGSELQALGIAGTYQDTETMLGDYY